MLSPTFHSRGELLLSRVKLDLPPPIEGMRAKIRCAQLWGLHGELGSITGGCEEAMALSIFSDIQRIAARALA